MTIKETTMKRKQMRAVLAAIAAMVVCGVVAPSAGAAFGPTTFDTEVIANPAGDAFTQAAGHPYEVSTTIDFNTKLDSENNVIPDDNVKNIHVDLPPGFVGNPRAVPYCTEEQLQQGTFVETNCPVDSVVGMSTVDTIGLFPWPLTIPLYNMKPAPGTAAAFGFNVGGGALVHLSVRLRPEDQGLTLDIPYISQSISLRGTRVTIWGDPSDPSHDKYRNRLCLGGVGSRDMSKIESCFGEEVSASTRTPAFLTLPSNCSAGPLLTGLRTESWQNPDVVATAEGPSHLPPGYPLPPAQWGSPQGVTGCGIVPFKPEMSVQPTTDRAEAPTGLDVSLEVPDAGFKNTEGIAQAYLKKAVVRLPEGMTINPSVAEGLGVCTPADFGRETATSNPGEGCPNSSTIGTIEIQTPALEETLHGSLYIAEQDDPATSAPGAENPFDSLLAMYIVARSPERGVILKLPGRITPDPKTGQLVTTFDDSPQLPFSKFTLHFREGQRSPLVSPPACGTYRTEADFSSWSATDPSNPTAQETVTDTSTFQITKGVGGGPCAGDNADRAFKPGLQAGALNNNAGSFSPVSVRMTRNDGEQEITSFSADLPQGLIGKLAGIPYCSDADIARAATRTGIEEKLNPSCPAGSEVGTTLVGAGVGSVLAYAPGKVYLAGPYHGSPLSIAAITSATVGPFDLGTVVVRSAFKVDPETAAVSVDSAGSDPIPHILEGIQLHIRDIRVYMDRPNFTLTPTSCNPFSFDATLTGSGADIANPADDVAARVSNRFQAANCSRLGFKPRLSFKLKGGTHRGDYPALRATLRPRRGDANIAKVAVTLPHSEFLAQEHIRTVCTRVQFAADQCPAASIYGKARAVTPLFDEPLEGPVYLRSSSNPLPDLVAKLNGQIQVNLVGRIDSVNQGIRNTFDVVPDAPVTKFTLSMQGGKKSLLVNSRNLCKAPGHAEVKMFGQNGKKSLTRPQVANSCANAGKRAH
ncbi:MAG TPA: hypothetical protein VGC49_11020 [Solirubrobacterales bacterium]